MRFLVFIVVLYSSIFMGCDSHDTINKQRLTDKTASDLAVLCKVWGYMKYYHPTVRNGNTDWDHELIRMIGEVLKASPKEDINLLLLNWVETIDSADHSADYTPYQFDLVKSQPDLEWLMDISLLGNDLSARLKKIHHYKLSEHSHFVSIDSLSGVAVFTNEIPYERMEFPDQGKQLLALFRLWNAVEYYFPYKYLIPSDWDEVLIDFISQFAEVRDALSYRLVTAKLIATLDDAHASLVRDSIYDNHKGKRIVPVEISFVENHAVITDLWDEHEFVIKTSLQKGDIIVALNGLGIENVVNNRLPYSSASNEPGKLKVIAMDLLRTNDHGLDIRVLRDGKQLSFIEATYPISKTGIFTKSFKNKPCYKAITEQVNYLYLSSSNGCDIPDLTGREGLIIDMRGYPAWDKINGFPDFSFFNTQQHDFAIWTRGSTIKPGYFHYSDTARIYSDLPGPIYPGKIVVLVNEVTLSQAEFLTMLFSSHPRSVVIGSQTAGTDGNVTTITLPDNLVVSFSGIGIYYPDRTETQQIGVKIDHLVQPTLEGVINGRDEILEKALDLF